MSTKTLVALVFAGVVAIQFLGLRACFLAVRPDDGRNIQPGSIDNSVVALADGSVMLAKPGTISRDVIDWFNNRNAPTRRFDIGRLPFVPNSAVPATDTAVRLERFATELKANPAVNAAIQVCTSGSGAADVRLAALRADSLKATLVANRVAADRISTEVCRAGDSGSVSGSASDQDGQHIGIVLDRQS
jgi:hypothetical protein